MKVPARRTLMAILAAAAVVAALTIAWSSFQRMRFHAAQIEARRTELAALADLSRQFAGQRAAYDQIRAEAVPGDRLEQVVRRTLGGITTDLVLREARPAGQGWTFRQHDMRVESITADRLSSFLEACANARPAVRILDMQVSARRDAPGALNAQLVLAELLPPGLGSAP